MYPIELLLSATEAYRSVLHIAVRLSELSRLRIVTIGLSAVILLHPVTGCTVDIWDHQNPTIEVTVHGHSLTAEVASTPKSQLRGLSLRRSLPPNRGMLFVFSEKKNAVFWMRDTFIPLSVAFIDTDGSVVGIQDMEPNNARRLYRSPKPVHFALEVNQGWFSSAGVGIGDKVEFQLPEDIVNALPLAPYSRSNQ